MGQLARASALQFTINIGKTVLGALVTLYFVNELGASVFGGFVLVVAIVSWVRIPAVAIRSATTKRISESESQSRLHTAGLVAQAAFASVVGLVVLLLEGYINSYLGFVGATWVILLVFPFSLGDHFGAVLEGRQRFESMSILDGLQSLVKSVAKFLLVFTGGGVTALLLGELLGGLAALATGIALVGLSVDVPKRSDFRSLYEFARYSWIGSFRTLSYSWVDTLVLGFLVSKAVVGAYEVAWRVSLLFVLAPQALRSILFGAISSRASEDAMAEAERVLRRGLSFAAGLAIPGVVGATLLGRDILALYGQSVVAVSDIVLVLIVLSVGRIAESFEMLIVTTLGALDFPDRAFRVSSFFLVTNLVFNVVLGVLFQAPGTAVATALSITLSLTYAWRQLPAGFDVEFPFREVGNQVVAALVMGGVVGLLLTIRAADSVLLTVGYVGVGAVVYAGGVLLLSREARSRLEQVVHETSSLVE